MSFHVNLGEGKSSALEIEDANAHPTVPRFLEGLCRLEGTVGEPNLAAVHLFDLRHRPKRGCCCGIDIRTVILLT